jgi:outer membrane protein OmpA-like peptidoglycan-associated protein
LTLIVLAAATAHALPGKESSQDKTKGSAPAATAAVVTKTAPKDTTSGAGPAATNAAPAPAVGDAPGKGVWLDYDFVPGDRTLWFEDFSNDTVGNFPHRLELVGGNFAVAEVEGRHYLRTSEGGVVTIALPESLPPRFTVEAQYRSNQDNNPLSFITNTGSPAIAGACEFGCSMHSAYVGCAGKNTSSTTTIPDEHGFIDARFAIDGKSVKAYVNEKRVASVPDAVIARTNKIQIQLPGASDGDPSLVTSIRIAASGKNLFDALTAGGRATTQGILFDTGSDRIRAESTPTLKEIGEMLKAHPSLKLMIEDHTDNTGADDANLGLSSRRAAAVRSYLLASYGIAEARLKAKGLGASKPIAPNTTAEGRQDNRRVDLVKI